MLPLPPLEYTKSDLADYGVRISLVRINPSAIFKMADASTIDERFSADRREDEERIWVKPRLVASFEFLE
jgi:hypothetical protein